MITSSDSTLLNRLLILIEDIYDVSDDEKVLKLCNETLDYMEGDVNESIEKAKAHYRGVIDSDNKYVGDKQKARATRMLQILEADAG